MAHFIEWKIEIFINSVWDVWIFILFSICMRTVRNGRSINNNRIYFPDFGDFFFLLFIESRWRYFVQQKQQQWTEDKCVLLHVDETTDGWRFFVSHIEFNSPPFRKTHSFIIESDVCEQCRIFYCSFVASELNDSINQNNLRYTTKWSTNKCNHNLLLPSSNNNIYHFKIRFFSFIWCSRDESMDGTDDKIKPNFIIFMWHK